MKIRIAASLGLLLGVTATSFAAEPPSVRLGLPTSAPIAGQRIVRAQDGESDMSLPRLPEPPLLPRPLPSLGKPIKAAAAQPSSMETMDAQLTLTRFLIGQSVAQTVTHTVAQPPAPADQPATQPAAPSAAPMPQAPTEAPKPADAGTPPPKGSDAPPSSAPANVMSTPAPVFSTQMATSGFCGSDMVGTGCIGGGCPVQGKLYARAEYLLWFLQDHHTPALVTASTPTSGGILGMPGTTVIYGGEINAGEYHGGRLTVGAYVDDCHQLAVEGSFFFLLESDQSSSYSSAGLPVLARPFFSLDPAGEDAELVAFPSLLAGSVTSRIQSKMWGGEINARKAAVNGCGPHCISYNVDALAGFRYVPLEEDLTIREDLVTLAAVTTPTGELPIGTNIEIVDQFRTRNQFFGGQVGAAAAVVRGPLSLDLRFKLGIGCNRQTVNIDGVTIVRLPDGVTTATNGGLLARPSNIGRYKNEEFSVLPEINLNVGYELTEGLRVFAGYTFLYWTNVVRPGDQIDRVIDFTGGTRPAFTFNQRDFWLHGFNVGVELKY